MSINELPKRDQPPMVPTGFRDLDFLAPFCEGDLIVVAARPAVGRFRFALRLMRNVSESRVPVLFFALECTSDFVVKHWLESGGRNPRGMAHQALKMADAPFWCDDTVLTVERLVERAKRWRGELEPSAPALIVIDRFELIDTYASSTRRPTRERYEYVAQTLKQMARDLRVAVMLLSSVDRGAEFRPGHKPLLSDLPAGLADSAQVVGLLHRADAYERELPRTNMAQLEIAMQRNGPTGMVHLSCADLVFVDFEAEQIAGGHHGP